MKPVTGTAEIALAPVRVLPAGPPHTYIGIASGLLPGIRILANAASPPALPLTMLCAHMLECVLKAYVSRSGDDSRVKQADVRHSLNALWCLAHSVGFAVPATPPDWVASLSGLHESPYYLRYSTGVHGLVLPPTEPMVSELAALLEQVRSQLKQ